MHRVHRLVLSLLFVVLATSALAMPGAAGGGNQLSGLVAETMDAGGYTYALVDTGDRMVWAAGPPTPLKIGERISFTAGMPMRDFHSAALKRNFDLIYFAGALVREGQAAQAKPPAPKPAAAAPVEPVTAPEGGYSIAELFAKREELAGKTVTVRGRVVKVNNGIMGRNWLHIQDGSGKALDGNHDLTLTSEGTAKKDAVVTVTGVLAKDKDFGSGYFFSLILEEATLTGE